MTKNTGADLVQRLNEMIAKLIKENRSLKRQVLKMADRKSTAASTAVKRGRRTIQRRVQKARPAPKPKRRKPAVKAPVRRKPAAKAPARKPAKRRRRG